MAVSLENLRHILAQTARQRTKRSFGFNVFCLDRLRKLMQLQTANIGEKQTDFDEVWKILAAK